jgi:membrane peptidoglycan carboxypeptidase
MATYAAGGLRTDAHFVVTVRRGGDIIYGETLPSPDDPRLLDAGQAADLTYALTRESGQEDLAIKTGEWAFVDGVRNSDAWSIGYTNALAVAVWVGSKGAAQALIDADGAPINGAGLPTQILRRTVTDAQAAMGRQPAPFPPPAFTGIDNPPGSYSR